jgi:peptidoglycan/xylan/chitin deacetylase (PgdA/CDA1 family)
VSLAEQVRSMAGRAVGVARAPLVMLGRVRPEGAFVLTYHDVSTESGKQAPYYVSPAQLHAQLDQARRSGARFVELAELVDVLIRGGPLEGLAALTFDDGLVGVHHHALPVLAELEIPATVFVVTDRPGTDRPPWYPGADRTMTRAELVEVANAGVRLESHTRTHADLPTLEPAQLHDQLAASRAALEDLTGRPVEYLAYPFGHHDARVREAVAESGYRAAFTFLNGRVTPGIDRYRIPRLNMWKGQGRMRFAYHLARPASSWGDHQRDRVSGPGPQLVS